MKIFTAKKLCDHHFESNYISTGHRLIITAVPTLYLEDKQTKSDTTLRIRSCYKSMREDLKFKLKKSRKTIKDFRTRLSNVE
ncbi:unnamed protein product [Parnassius mnemosyne]|uniref:THAP-type domain-containing protein n=1 Tax=Parnassius mnemosyne TaxID=213953 RepID=A0AAV1LSK0_9NEOP